MGKIPLKSTLKLSDIDNEKDIEQIEKIVSSSLNLTSSQVIDKIKENFLIMMKKVIEILF